MRVTRNQLRQIIQEEMSCTSVARQLSDGQLPINEMPHNRPWADPESSKYVSEWIGWITQEDVDKLGNNGLETALKIFSKSTGRDLDHVVIKWDDTSGDLADDPETHIDYVIHFTSGLKNKSFDVYNRT